MSSLVVDDDDDNNNNNYDTSNNNQNIDSIEVPLLATNYKRVKKNYINLDSKKMLSYGKKYDETAQVTLEKHHGRFRFSFPMKNNINYAVYFNDKKKLNNYMEHIIKHYIT